MPTPPPSHALERTTTRDLLKTTSELLSLLAATVAGALILWIEPLSVRELLPAFGASPVVWTTAMAGFQSALLAGYAATSWITARASPHHQLLCIIALWALAIASLTHGAPSIETLDTSTRPALSVLAVLAQSMGTAMVVCATTAPILTAWSTAASPYRLFAASNAGSAIALIAYPLFIEPALTLGEQRSLWGTAIIALGLSITAIGALRAARRPQADTARARHRTAPPTSSRTLVRIAALAALPSAILVSITEIITTDIAPVPLLWVVPLALYIATFVHAFSPGPAIPAHWLAPLAAASLLMVLMANLVEADPLLMALSLLALLACTALHCHTRIARLAPERDAAPGYYLAIAAGGILGTVTVAFIAPALFDHAVETVLGITCIAATLADPSSKPPHRQPRPPWGPWAVAGTLVAVVATAAHNVKQEVAWYRSLQGLEWSSNTAAAAGMAALWSVRAHPVAFGTAATAMALAAFQPAKRDAKTRRRIEHHRGFYGRISVYDTRHARMLHHGSTLHGAEVRTREGTILSKTTYYSESSALGQLALGALSPHRSERILMLGLGTGSMLCYTDPSDHVDIVELNPQIVRIAREHFAAWNACPSSRTVTVADGRIAMQRIHADPASRAYDFIVVDTFSSDAIPVHLITTEALELAMGLLAPEGILVVHVSNRYLDLEPVIQANTRRLGIPARILSTYTHQRDQTLTKDTIAIAIAHRESVIDAMSTDPALRTLRANPAIRPWTDQYSAIAPALHVFSTPTRNHPTPPGPREPRRPAPAVQ